MPHVKVSEALERTYGLTVTPTTVLDITKRAVWWLWPEYNRILGRIRASPLVYVDETGVRVDGRRYWIWAFGWRRYPGFTDMIQRCWVYLLREADCPAEHVEEAKPLSQTLHGLYDRVKP